MKFLAKINRQYFWTLSILLVIVSVLGYFVLKYILTNEIKEDISEKEFAVINEIRINNNLPNIYPIIETQIISKNKSISKSYNEIFLWDELEGENEPYLEYTNTVKINDRYYLIKLRHSLLENNNLIMAIALPMLLLLMLAFVVSFVTTKKITKTVWDDFEVNLNEIKDFSFRKLKKLNLKQSNIEEFDSLNKAVIELTQKLQNDYQSLKEFTENASHEIQTPISIISLNLEELLQQDLSEQAFKQVVASTNAIKRLSDLSKSLLLLTKIDNQQYHPDYKVVMNDIIDAKIKEFSPLLKTGNLKIVSTSNEKFVIEINKELADILLNNLMSNAIKHNVAGGEIIIETSAAELKICNTGKNNLLTNDTIFNRFTKENSQSYGLGLAIAKQICDTHYMHIKYTKNTLHCFTITLLK